MMATQPMLCLSGLLALTCLGSVRGGGNLRGGNLRGLQSTWDGTLNVTHYWDCNGQDCDSKTVPAIEETPGNWVWQIQLFSASPLYAPMDPNDYGGPSEHGEKFWATGAVSDDLAALLGADDPSCGVSDLSPGGCGKCLLVQNAYAINSDWKVMVMKKNRCPPYSHGCEAGKIHLDMAVPGYDYVSVSTGNVCAGNPKEAEMDWRRDNTFGMTYDSSSSCSKWWDGNDNTQAGCDCSSVTSDHGLRAGCQLFTEWGWRATETPQLSYKVVDCPATFKSIISGAFTAEGPSASTSVTEATTTTAAPVTVATTTTAAPVTVATTTTSSPSCEYVAHAKTAVSFQGTGGPKLKRKKYASTAAYLAACKASCNADSRCRGFVDDPTDRRGRRCKPKETSSGYRKKGKTFYAKGVGC